MKRPVRTGTMLTLAVATLSLGALVTATSASAEPRTGHRGSHGVATTTSTAKDHTTTTTTKVLPRKPRKEQQDVILPPTGDEVQYWVQIPLKMSNEGIKYST